MVSTRKISMSIILVALGVVLSPVNIPMGPTKAFPIQHMINAVAGILLGPWYAMLIATAIGAIRISLGTGTIFAFPGGIPGALIVGFFYWYVRKTDYSAFTEPIGTSIGAVISALFIVQFFPRAMPPIFGITSQATLFVIYWLFSCVPGSILGFLVVKALRRTGFADRILIPTTVRKESSNRR